MNWYLKCVQKSYFDFSGRARRKEFWMFTLFNVIFTIAAQVIDSFIGWPVATLFYSVAVLIPSLSVCVRRLHDVGKSGWMYFIALIPIIGAIWLFVLFCKDGQPGSNNWGKNPKEA